MWEKLKRLAREEEAQGMVEYILIIAIVAVLVVVALRAFGTRIQGWFQRAGDRLDQEVPAGNP